MTSIPLPGNDIGVCGIRDWGEWDAMDSYRSAFATASADELTGGGGAVYLLRQAALETVIADRMRGPRCDQHSSCAAGWCLGG
jgi:hypothetical protein